MTIKREFGTVALLWNSSFALIVLLVCMVFVPAARAQENIKINGNPSGLEQGLMQLYR